MWENTICRYNSWKNSIILNLDFLKYFQCVSGEILPLQKMKTLDFAKRKTKTLTPDRSCELLFSMKTKHIPYEVLRIVHTKHYYHSTWQSIFFYIRIHWFGVFSFNETINTSHRRLTSRYTNALWKKKHKKSTKKSNK